MTTNNSINQASEILVVGPIGTSQDGSVPLTVRKDQSGTTAISLINQTDNSATQGFFQLKVQQHNSGSPFTSTAGLGIYNDQAASNVYAGYAVIQNDLGGSNGTKGIVVWNADATNVVKVGVGLPASAVDQAIWNSSGGQYRGFNGNTAPPAGYLGELITANATTGTLTSNVVANVTSVSLTAGIWDISAVCTYATTGTVAGNTQYYAAISTANNNLTGVGENGSTQTGGQLAVNGSNSVSVWTGPTRVTLSGTVVHYLNCRGFASVTFSNVTCTGIIRAVRVG